MKSPTEIQFAPRQPKKKTNIYFAIIIVCVKNDSPQDANQKSSQTHLLYIYLKLNANLSHNLAHTVWLNTINTSLDIISCILDTCCVFVGNVIRIHPKWWNNYTENEFWYGAACVENNKKAMHQTIGIHISNALQRELTVRNSAQLMTPRYKACCVNIYFAHHARSFGTILF